MKKIALIFLVCVLAWPALGQVSVRSMNGFSTNQTLRGEIIAQLDRPMAHWSVWNDHTNYFAYGFQDNVYLATNNFSGLLQDIADRPAHPFLATAINISPSYQSATESFPYWASNTVVITNSVVFRGAGNSATRIRGAAALTTPAFQLGESGGGYNSGIFAFHSIRFEGAGAGAGSAALRYINGGEPIIWDCVFNGWKGQAIRISMEQISDWSIISRNWFIIQTGGDGILIDSTPSQVGPMRQELMVVNNLFAIGSGRGIKATADFNNIMIQGNRFSWEGPFSTTAEAISLSGGFGSSISGNIFVDWLTNTVPIRLENRAVATNLNAIVSGNIASRYSITGQPSTPVMVYVGDNVQGVTLQANQSSNGLLTGNGFQLGTSTGTPMILDRGTNLFPGSMGIGVLPARKFHVRDDALAARFDRGGGNGPFHLFVRFTDTGYGTVARSWITGVPGGTDYVISDNGTSVTGVGTPRLTITPGGDVEINTGALKLSNTAVAETPAASHTLRIKDATGQEYRVLAIPVP